MKKKPLFIIAAILGIISLMLVMMNELDDMNKEPIELQQNTFTSIHSLSLSPSIPKYSRVTINSGKGLVYKGTAINAPKSIQTFSGTHDVFILMQNGKQIHYSQEIYKNTMIDIEKPVEMKQDINFILTVAALMGKVAETLILMFSILL